MTLPAGVKQEIRGSSWGTFTIACTVPIALFVGLYMYRIRKGRVVEASLIGAAATLAVTVIGAWIPGSPIEPCFQLSRGGTIWAICIYGFVASVLPVWLLLCPRDYLSSFLKIGTIALLVGAVIVANPKLEAPPINHGLCQRRRADSQRSDLPVLLHLHHVRSDFRLSCPGLFRHDAQDDRRESHIRTIGYGAMLMEGLVGVVALISAATLSPRQLLRHQHRSRQSARSMPKNCVKMGADTDTLAHIEQQVGGESLRGRTAGAVTLAVGMSQICTEAMDRLSRRPAESRLGDQVLVSLRDHVRGAVHSHHDRHRHAHRPISAARSAGQNLSAVRADRLAARRGAFDGRGHGRLGPADRHRLDRHDLADVRHRQSDAGGDRAGGGDDRDVQRAAAAATRRLTILPMLFVLARP